MIEEWKDVIGMEGFYEVSNAGRIRNFKTKAIRKLIIGTTGYPSTSFYKSKNEKFFLKVHRLVAKAFVSNPNGYKFVNHIDGNKQNNRSDNLEWCTFRHNIQHAFRLGLTVSLKGENHPKAKLTLEQIEKIKHLHESGLSERKIVSEIGCTSRRNVRSIISGKSWK